MYVFEKVALHTNSKETNNTVTGKIEQFYGTYLSQVDKITDFFCVR